MPRRHLVRCALFAILLGLACDYTLAAWLGWRRGGIVTHVSFDLSSSRFHAFYWQGDFGRESLECNLRRHMAPHAPTLAELRHQYTIAYPDPLEGGLRPGLPERSADRAKLLLPRWASSIILDDTEGNRGMQATGFPFRSYCREYDVGYPRVVQLTRGTLAQHPTDARRFVPCIPLARGVAINTALWALLWFPVLVGIPVARRRLRVRRGRCIHCNYDLRGVFSAGCPECGWNRSAVTSSPPTPAPPAQ